VATEFKARELIDFLSEASGGMNSGVAPLLVSKNQVAFGQNISLRGGFLNTRPPYQKKTLNFGGDLALQNAVLTGKFQGGGYYRPDFGTESLIAQIQGRLFKFTESGASWQVSEISIPGDLNDPTVSQVWMWQSEKWLIIQDGSGALPIFFDGTISRRSYGPSILLGTAASYSPAAPPAIGSVETVTLVAPYTGPYNVPVIFNGEFYQPIQNPAGYQVILTNLNDTPGNTVAQGSAVVIESKTVAVTTEGFSGSLSATSVFKVTSVAGLQSGTNEFFPPYAPDNGITGVFISGLKVNGNDESGIQWLINRGITQNPPTFSIQFSNSGGQTVSWQAGAIISVPSTNPNVIVGLTAASFVVPALNGSVSINLDRLYTGSDNQIVSINGAQYLLSAVSHPGDPFKLALINLTDNATANYASSLTIKSVPEIPAGRQGAYGMGCNCCALTDGISYIIGDVVGSGAGTQANNYRDAVLKVTQNDFLFGGGSFHIPGTGDSISAVIFPPNLDTSLGQGPLQIGTGFSFFTNVVPGTDPANWPTLTTPIQTESLKDNGALGQNSTISVNSDTFFRSSIGVGSLVLARRAFQGWGNKPISNEIGNILDLDDQTLLQYGSSISFGNRFQTTTNPISSPNGIVHRGQVSLNFDLISTLRQQLPPAWEGLNTGLNILQAISGRVNGSLRAFAFSYNFLTSALELYEFLPESTDSFADNDSNPIVWAFETPVVFNSDIKSLNELIQLRDGEVYLSDIQGNVHVDVYYRPDFYPCWTKWNGFDVCESSDAANSKPGYRMRIGLGQPSVDDCEISNNRPLRLGYFFQLRVVITGSCTWKGIRVKAVTIPQPEFAPIICDTESCQLIGCDLPDPYALYSLQGIPPQVNPTPQPPVQQFVNNVVYITNYCASGLPYFFGTNLPPWITVDSANNRLIGAAGNFRGGTQADADAAAIAGLTAIAPSLNIQCGFYNTQQVVTCSDSSTQTVPAGVFFSTVSQADANNQAIALANVQCANPSCNPSTGGKFKIFGYFDGYITADGDVGQAGDVTWDGSFTYTGGCNWAGGGSFSSGHILINGKRVCARIFFSGSNTWVVEIYQNFGNTCNALWWGGTKLKGSSPAGVYPLTGGIDGAPTSITIVPA